MCPLFDVWVLHMAHIYELPPFFHVSLSDFWKVVMIVEFVSLAGFKSL